MKGVRSIGEQRVVRRQSSEKRRGALSTNHTNGGSFLVRMTLHGAHTHQRAIATCTHAGAASTWNFTSCRVARAAACASSAATTPPAGTATTAKKAITATPPKPLLIARRVKVIT